jgi:pyrroloquinoline quinone (PQQ) biosynthesis protein C
MTKADELKYGCINRCADDEPVFVLRAHDRCAPKTIRLWADFAESQGVTPTKVAEAREVARQMERWSESGGGAKWPD